MSWSDQIAERLGCETVYDWIDSDRCVVAQVRGTRTVFAGSLLADPPAGALFRAHELFALWLRGVDVFPATLLLAKAAGLAGELDLTPEERDAVLGPHRVSRAELQDWWSGFTPSQQAEYNRRKAWAQSLWYGQQGDDDAKHQVAAYCLRRMHRAGIIA